VVFTHSELQQRVSARRISRARVIPLARAATQQWLAAVTPEGQGEKHPSAALLVLEAGWLLRWTSALHLNASRLAECVNTTLQEYHYSMMNMI